LLNQKCLNHQTREAIARCPQCRRFFCRECVVEHDDRLICTTCLQSLNRPQAETKRHFQFAGRFLAVCAGFLLAWLFFYFVGEGLMLIPSSVHDGSTLDSK
jgi:hypothetical protein